MLDADVPTLLIDSWFDAPLPGVCDDFAALRDCGTPVALRIGGGGHLDGGGEGAAEATLDWFDAYLLDGRSSDPSTPVTVHVQGDGGEWRELADLAAAELGGDALVPPARWSASTRRRPTSAVARRPTATTPPIRLPRSEEPAS